MNPTAGIAARVDTVLIERGEESSAVARRILERLPNVAMHVVDDVATVQPADMNAGKRVLAIQRHRGTFLQHCPAGTTGMVCCNYLVVNFASNCPYDCSYCFLQDYLANNPVLKVYSNPEDGLAELDGVLRKATERTLRIGTGELADSLALDGLTDLSCELVPFFAQRDNALLELKTKSTCIDNLLRLDPRDRVVVSWSVNAANIAAAEEHGAAPLEARIDAARRVQAAGYRVGFHFDPLIAHDGWEESYRDAVEAVFAGLDTGRVAWVSLGSLRMTPRLKSAVRRRHQLGHVLTGELVAGADGKERLWRGLRVKMYRRMLGWLRAVDERMPLYICMEPAAVWEKVVGQAPSDRDVAQSLVARP
jgi:spore photoproduct lyase